jgi:hypothetical protein
MTLNTIDNLKARLERRWVDGYPEPLSITVMVSPSETLITLPSNESAWAGNAAVRQVLNRKRKIKEILFRDFGLVVIREGIF